ncbi:MAG: YdcF family protein [Clostridia bacterium]|nr:YdcF family protein [Clostridia bacterium]
MKKIIKITVAAFLLAVIALTAANLFVVFYGKSYFFSETKIKELSDKDSYDCILVLGCGVYNDVPSPMLEDRLEAAVKLYFDGVAPKLLMSGDHGTSNYDEVNVMRNYAIEHGIPEEDIFMDHAGFSTYESMKRAKEIFGCEKMVIVTQKYHLYRAVFDARGTDIDAYGYVADKQVFVQQPYYSAREILARAKDVLFTIIDSKDMYMGGPEIDIHGNGNITIG